MSTLTPRDVTLLTGVTLLGIVFFLVVCVIIIAVFKRLKREDARQLRRQGQVPDDESES